MIEHTTSIRVRYGETDQMGHCYYGNFALYYEIGRTELIRSLGITYKELEKQNYILPVLNLQSSYHLPAQYDDDLKIKTILLQKPLIKNTVFICDYKSKTRIDKHGRNNFSILAQRHKKTEKNSTIYIKGD